MLGLWGLWPAAKVILTRTCQKLGVAGCFIAINSLVLSVCFGEGDITVETGMRSAVYVIACWSDCLFDVLYIYWLLRGAGSIFRLWYSRLLTVLARSVSAASVGWKQTWSRLLFVMFVVYVLMPSIPKSKKCLSITTAPQILSDTNVEELKMSKVSFDGDALAQDCLNTPTINVRLPKSNVFDVRLRKQLAARNFITTSIPFRLFSLFSFSFSLF
jgi:hypothetical protein